jgi:hypothetical protein
MAAPDNQTSTMEATVRATGILSTPTIIAATMAAKATAVGDADASVAADLASSTLAIVPKAFNHSVVCTFVPAAR